MRAELPPPTPPASPTVSVLNLASLAAANIPPRTCPSTCNCPKICELAADTDAPAILVDTAQTGGSPAATATATATATAATITTTTTYEICPSADDEVIPQTLNPEAQDFTPKASGSYEPILLPASIENKASCSRGPKNCCKTSEAAPCNAAKLEKLHLNKKAIQAAAVTCCGLRTLAVSYETIDSCVKKDTACHGCLKDVEDFTNPASTSPESGFV